MLQRFAHKLLKNHESDGSLWNLYLVLESCYCYIYIFARQGFVFHCDAHYRNSYAAAQGASVRGEESSVAVGPKCTKCNKTVYFAEEVVACRRKWHKLCLKCGELIDFSL